MGAHSGLHATICSCSKCLNCFVSLFFFSDISVQEISPALPFQVSLSISSHLFSAFGNSSSLLACSWDPFSYITVTCKIRSQVNQLCLLLNQNGLLSFYNGLLNSWMAHKALCSLAPGHLSDSAFVLLFSHTRLSHWPSCCFLNLASWFPSPNTVHFPWTSCGSVP